MPIMSDLDLPPKVTLTRIRCPDSSHLMSPLSISPLTDSDPEPDESAKDVVGKGNAENN